MQFRCSLVCRRFPALKMLPDDQLADLICSQRQTTGTKLETVQRTFPKSEEPSLVKELCWGSESQAHWMRSLEDTKGRLGMRTRRNSIPDATAEKFVQRNNPVWQWAGHPAPGQEHWLCSGSASARRDIERPYLQVCTHAALCAHQQ